MELVRDDLDDEVEKELDVEEGTTVDDLLDSRGIEKQEVLVSRNGRIITGKHKLEAGDKVRVFDVIAGG
ncbi:MAG: MoaD/ThiS family protein [Candidatus Nanohaloarchaea archaeon]